MIEPKPQKIQDIIFRMEEFISYIREIEKDKVMNVIEGLESFIMGYFSTTKEDLKKVATELVDGMYIQISKLSKRDMHTDAYFSIIINRLFWEFNTKGVKFFFVLDNKLRDDRFKLTTELYKNAGFAVIYPYTVKDLEYSENHSNLQKKDYKTTEGEINDTLEQKRPILYVEKDESVNYVESILHIAEDHRNEYVCIFRNKAPEDGQLATVMFGSTTQILKAE